MLCTNTDLETAEAALQYQQLWMVEHWFRSCKTLLQTGPIYHKRDDTIRGHVFCSFLALVIRQELQSRLAERGHKLEWADVIQDVDRLQQHEVASQRLPLRPGNGPLEVIVGLVLGDRRRPVTPRPAPGHPSGLAEEGWAVRT